MKQNKTAIWTALVIGSLALLVAPAWAQMKGSDTPGSTPRSSQKDNMKSNDSGKSSSSSSDQIGDRSAASSSAWDKEDIKKVQEALKDKGNDPGPVDGIVGPQTKKALRAFQSSQNLKTTGRLDAETAKALGVEHGSSSSSSSGSSMGNSSSSSSSSQGSSSKGSSTGKGKEPAAR
jgi:hypothetical protein